MRLVIYITFSCIYHQLESAVENYSIFRPELLTMVKQHSKFLKEGMLDEDDSSDVEMDLKFWNEMLDLYFVRGRETKGGHDDDLIFFVRDMVNSHEYIFQQEFICSKNLISSRIFRICMDMGLMTVSKVILLILFEGGLLR